MEMHGRIDVPGLLAQWRTRELDIAHSFKECGRVSTSDIEEILDATTFALLEKDYETEEHLRAALHRGIKMRALRLHRDRINHRRTLQKAALPVEATAKSWEQDPQRALIAREDRIIISEFLAELTPTEQQVFALIADGRSWRAIATALGMPPTEARTTTRSCERKRERFFMLYQTGRLCGYRSQTIGALLNGTQTNDLALRQALAHLHHCRTCRTQHHTTEEQLRAAFDRRALALLPIPVTLLHAPTGILDRLHDLITRHARILGQLHVSQTGLRERAIETITGVGAAAKITVGVIGAVALATGAVNVQHHDRRAAHPKPTARHLRTVALWQPGQATAPAPPQRGGHPRPHLYGHPRSEFGHVRPSARPHADRYVALSFEAVGHMSAPGRLSGPPRSPDPADERKAQREFGLEHN
jgi:DNA-directed RNA polymerase specialized sigma24 family protein